MTKERSSFMFAYAPYNGVTAIYYDPAQSVRYSNANEEAKVAEVTSILRTKFPNAFLANFRGDAGVQSMEADLLAQFVPKLVSYSVEPFPTFAGPGSGL